MKPLTVGALCAGYGGLEQGLAEVLDIELAWVADPDPGAAAILKHHHPNVPNLGDIKLANWKNVIDEHGSIDILTGGYPCQPFSLAGLGLGVEDERHLWPYLADALRVLRPRYALFENVANHLRVGFDTVLADLAALGFDVGWCTIRASDIGAPHGRPRLIFLATATDASRVEPERWGSAGVLGSPQAAQPCEADQRERAGDTALDRCAPTSDTTDLGHERLRDAWGRGTGPADSNLTPAHADCSGQRPHESDVLPGQSDTGRRAASDATGRGRRPEPREQRGERTEERLTADIAWGDYEPAIRRWEAILERPAPRPTEFVRVVPRATHLPIGMRGSLQGYDPRLKGYPKHRLSPRFSEWLMGLPAGHVTDVPGLSRNQQLKAIGNGVVPQQVAAALRLLLPAVLDAQREPAA